MMMTEYLRLERNTDGGVGSVSVLPDARGDRQQTHQDDSIFFNSTQSPNIDSKYLNNSEQTIISVLTQNFLCSGQDYQDVRHANLTVVAAQNTIGSLAGDPSEWRIHF